MCFSTCSHICQRGNHLRWQKTQWEKNENFQIPFNRTAKLLQPSHYFVLHNIFYAFTFIQCSVAAFIVFSVFEDQKHVVTVRATSHSTPPRQI